MRTEVLSSEFEVVVVVVLVDTVVNVVAFDVDSHEVVVVVNFDVCSAVVVDSVVKVEHEYSGHGHPFGQFSLHGQFIISASNSRAQ